MHVTDMSEQVSDQEELEQLIFNISISTTAFSIEAPADIKLTSFIVSVAPWVAARSRSKHVV